LLDRVELVPDQVVLDMVREELVAVKAAGGGYVLDGIPRNMQQARAAYLIGRELEMTAVVALHLQADDGELMRRLLTRADSNIATTTPQKSLPSAWPSTTK
jgi:adenylate kinase